MSQFERPEFDLQKIILERSNDMEKISFANSKLKVGTYTNPIYNKIIMLSISQIDNYCSELKTTILNDNNKEELLSFLFELFLTMPDMKLFNTCLIINSLKDIYDTIYVKYGVTVFNELYGESQKNIKLIDGITYLYELLMRVDYDKTIYNYMLSVQGLNYELKHSGFVLEYILCNKPIDVNKWLYEENNILTVLNPSNLRLLIKYDVLNFDYVDSEGNNIMSNIYSKISMYIKPSNTKIVLKNNFDELFNNIYRTDEMIETSDLDNLFTIKNEEIQKSLNTCNIYGYYPIHTLFLNNDYDSCYEHILKYKHNVNLQDSDGYTVLHYVLINPKYYSFKLTDLFDMFDCSLYTIYDKSYISYIVSQNTYLNDDYDGIRINTRECINIYKPLKNYTTSTSSKTHTSNTSNDVKSLLIKLLTNHNFKYMEDTSEIIKNLCELDYFDIVKLLFNNKSFIEFIKNNKEILNQFEYSKTEVKDKFLKNAQMRFFYNKALSCIKDDTLAPVQHNKYWLF